jgi:hypothetical protein
VRAAAMDEYPFDADWTWLDDVRPVGLMSMVDFGLVKRLSAGGGPRRPLDAHLWAGRGAGAILHNSPLTNRYVIP